MKQLAAELVEADREAGVQPQITFIEGDREDKNNKPRLVLLGEAKGAIELDFPPGHCQFCAKEVTKDMSNVEKEMWEHLIVDCPCCCICPQCHQVIEICYLSNHMCSGRECSGKAAYQFDLQMCPKCQQVFEN